MIVGGRKIEVWRASEFPNGEGGFTTTWTQICYERGRIVTASSRPSQTADLSKPEVSTTLFLRIAANVENGDKLKWDRGGAGFVSAKRDMGDHLEVDCLNLQDE